MARCLLFVVSQMDELEQCRSGNGAIPESTLRRATEVFKAASTAVRGGLGRVLRRTERNL